MFNRHFEINLIKIIYSKFIIILITNLFVFNVTFLLKSLVNPLIIKLLKLNTAAVYQSSCFTSLAALGTEKVLQSALIQNHLVVATSFISVFLVFLH